MVFDHASKNQNNSTSLHPTSAYNYDSMTRTLSPTSSLINPPPTLLYPDKLPKYIKEKDDIDTRKPREKNKNKGKNKNAKKKKKNDKEIKKVKNANKKESNGIDKDITREKYMKKRVKQYDKKYQSKENKSYKFIPRGLTRKPSS